MRRVLAFLGIDADRQSPKLLEILSRSPEHCLLGDNDARKLAAFYQPFDLQRRVRRSLLACRGKLRTPSIAQPGIEVR